MTTDLQPGCQPLKQLTEADVRRIVREVLAAEKPKLPLKQLLAWRMCSDPWPGGDVVVIDAWLDSESRAAGFSSWIDAYHQLEG